MASAEVYAQLQDKLSACEKHNEILREENNQLKESLEKVLMEKDLIQLKVKNAESFFDSVKQELFQEIAGMQAINRRLNKKLNQYQVFDLPCILTKSDFNIANYQNTVGKEVEEVLKESIIEGFQQKRDLTEASIYVVEKMRT